MGNDNSMLDMLLTDQLDFPGAKELKEIFIKEAATNFVCPDCGKGMYDEPILSVYREKARKYNLV